MTMAGSSDQHRRGRPFSRAVDSEVELAVLRATDERVPFGGREDQGGSVGVLRIADGDRLADERHLDTVVAVGSAAVALEPLCAAQIDPETLGLNFHNGSSTSTSIIFVDSSGVRAVAWMLSKILRYLCISSVFSKNSPPVAFSA